MPVRTPRVYIPNLSSHDHSDAERYGELVYVTKGRIAKFAASTMYREWMNALKDSEPTDCILLTSLSTLQAIGAAVFGAMHGRINLILWHDPTKKYIKRDVLFQELMDNTISLKE